MPGHRACAPGPRASLPSRRALWVGWLWVPGLDGAYQIDRSISFGGRPGRPSPPGQLLRNLGETLFRGQDDARRGLRGGIPVRGWAEPDWKGREDWPPRPSDAANHPRQERVLRRSRRQLNRGAGHDGRKADGLSTVSIFRERYRRGDPDYRRPQPLRSPGCSKERQGLAFHFMGLRNCRHDRDTITVY